MRPPVLLAIVIDSLNPSALRFRALGSRSTSEYYGDNYPRYRLPACTQLHIAKPSSPPGSPLGLKHQLLIEKLGVEIVVTPTKQSIAQLVPPIAV
jgi:hypothetical protein